MPDRLKACKKAVGIKQTLKAVEGGNAKLVFIARDADDRVVGPIEELSRNQGIEVVHVDNMKQLGKSCEIDVGAAAACILKTV